MNTARRQFAPAMTRRRIGVPALYGKLPTARNGRAGRGASVASSLSTSTRAPKRARRRPASEGSISMTVTSFGRATSFSVSTPSPGPISRIRSSGDGSTAATMRSPAPRLRRKFCPHFFFGAVTGGMLALCAMKELTASEFATATATGVALVDFSTEWCAPCKTMMPIVQRIATDYAGRLSVFSVHAEKEQELAMRQAVMSFPTFLILKDGKVVDRVIGAIA